MSGKSNHIESLTLKNEKRASPGKLSRLERYGSLQNEKRTFSPARKKLLILNLKQNQKRKRIQHKRNIFITVIVCFIAVLLLLLIIL